MRAETIILNEERNVSLTVYLQEALSVIADKNLGVDKSRRIFIDLNPRLQQRGIVGFRQRIGNPLVRNARQHQSHLHPTLRRMLLPHNYPKLLKELGIQCKVFAPVSPFISTHYNYRDHRKILVIDGHTAFNGGVNLADEYINRVERFGHWKDTPHKTFVNDKILQEDKMLRPFQLTQHLLKLLFPQRKVCHLRLVKHRMAAASGFHAYSGMVVFSLLMVLYLLNSRINPTAKITWLIIMMLMPVFGALLYWYTQRDIGHRALKARFGQIVDMTRDHIRPSLMIKYSRKIKCSAPSS